MELYVHIPFCVKKCNYCDFLSYPGYGREADDIRKLTAAKYVDALCLELELIGKAYGEKKEGFRTNGIGTCFIGGGTPSVLGLGESEKLFDSVSRLIRTSSEYAIHEKTEFTVECNPGTVDKEKLSIYKRYGVNRLSMGLQSADDASNALLGRIHTFGQFKENYFLARSMGFENINIDLISGIPHQTTDLWEETLRRAAELGPEHISAYSLILEEGTLLYDMYRKDPKSLSLPDEDSERRMYHLTDKVLKEYGYHRYEISNYSKDGYECRHNKGYWTGEEYIGTGLGAASYLSYENAVLFKKKALGRMERERNEEPPVTGKMLRIKNCNDICKYTIGLPYANANGKTFTKETDAPECDIEESLNEEDMMAEFFILGLRMIRGVSYGEFEKRFGKKVPGKYLDTIYKYVGKGLLKELSGRVCFTERGLDLSNTVLGDFL